jgi:8-oxo-dGTP pyrophosphatase MutT (NUDIX family)
MSSSSVVVYVTREHPQTAHDQLLVLDSGRVPRGKRDRERRTIHTDAGVELRVVRELGEAAAGAFVQATPTEATADAWEHAGRRWRWVQLHRDLELPQPDAAFLREIVRSRVVAYVTRDRDGRTELLTIEAAQYPEEGIQVPAGRIDHGETLEEGLRRELAEETGVTGVRVLRELPDFECTYPTFYDNHAFHVVAEEKTADAWEHRVRGKGADSGLVHLCRWVPLTPDLELWNEGDPMLKHLPI